MSEITIPSNPADRKKLKEALVEMTRCLQKIDDEKLSMKDISDDAAAKFAIPKKIITKLARTMYKRNYDTLQTENEDFETLYEILVEGKRDDATSALNDLDEGDE